MELAVTQRGFNRKLGRKQARPLIFENEGILVSAYKNEIQDNFFNANPESIYGVKQRIKSGIYQSGVGFETLLKLSVFLVAISLALA